MRLELQKLKTVAMSEIGGGNSGMSHNGMIMMGPMGDQSPKSFDGRHINGALTQRKQKGGILSDNDQLNTDNNLSESDDIQLQF